MSKGALPERGHRYSPQAFTEREGFRPGVQHHPAHEAFPGAAAKMAEPGG